MKNVNKDKQKMKKSLHHSELIKPIFNSFISKLPMSVLDEVNLTIDEFFTVFECYVFLKDNLLVDYDNTDLLTVGDFIEIMSDNRIRISKIENILKSDINSLNGELDMVSNLVKTVCDILPSSIDDNLFNDYVKDGYLDFSEDEVDILKLNYKIFTDIKGRFSDTSVTKDIVVKYLKNELVENPSIFKRIIDSVVKNLNCITDTYSIKYDDFGRNLISDIENTEEYTFENLPYLLNYTVFQIFINEFEKVGLQNDVNNLKQILKDIDYSNNNL